MLSVGWGAACQVLKAESTEDRHICFLWVFVKAVLLCPCTATVNYNLLEPFCLHSYSLGLPTRLQSLLPHLHSPITPPIQSYPPLPGHSIPFSISSLCIYYSSSWKVFPFISHLVKFDALRLNPSTSFLMVPWALVENRAKAPDPILQTTQCAQFSAQACELSRSS